jgi:glycine/D-amino acid oxidase-like deaminating enzyme
MKKVAVLGAGIMGSATSLFLARRGVSVTLFDAASRPFSGASRWNEGKVHLGFLYSADPSFRTADRLLPGGLAFKPLIEDLLGRSIEPATTGHDDVFLLHRKSVVGPEAAEAYFTRLADRVRAAPNATRYLVNVSRASVRRLTARQLSALADARHVNAGFVVPERSVSTRWIADAFLEALAAEQRIDFVPHAIVRAVESADGHSRSRLTIRTADGRTDGPFDTVVNALWEGRLAIDSSLGLRPRGIWSHRYRRCLFVRTRTPVDVPSAVVCAGPFGDVKSYSRHDFYVSWYPAGLLAAGEDLVPPPTPLRDAAANAALARATFDGLGAILGCVRDIRLAAQTVDVEGGWIFARGRGSLGNARSSLHTRHRVGIHRRGPYVSVDTGKYSIAPWLAREVADQIAGA